MARKQPTTAIRSADLHKENAINELKKEEEAKKNTTFYGFKDKEMEMGLRGTGR